MYALFYMSKMSNTFSMWKQTSLVAMEVWSCAYDNAIYWQNIKTVFRAFRLHKPNTFKKLLWCEHRFLDKLKGKSIYCVYKIPFRIIKMLLFHCFRRRVIICYASPTKFLIIVVFSYNSHDSRHPLRGLSESNMSLRPKRPNNQSLQVGRRGLLRIMFSTWTPLRH